MPTLEEKIAIARYYDGIIKETQKELSELKKAFAELEPGTYNGNNGSVMAISEANRYDDIDIGYLRQALTSRGLAHKLESCLKVVWTVAKKYVPDLEREVIGKTRRYSFK